MAVTSTGFILVTGSATCPPFYFTGLSSSPAVTDEISNLMRSTSSTTSHVKTYRVNSSSSNGTVPLDKQVSGSLHLCAEAVADVARRKAIEERCVEQIRVLLTLMQYLS